MTPWPFTKTACATAVGATGWIELDTLKRLLGSTIRVFARAAIGELDKAELVAYAALRGHDGHERAAIYCDTWSNGENA